MSNKFLSRGKREDNGEWVEGSLVFTNIIIPNTIDNMFFHYVNAKDSMTLGTGKYLTKDSMLKFYIVAPETVGHCTGLTNKNGKMIFEGDILQAGDYRFVVKFGKCGGVKNVDHEVGYIGFYVIPIGKDSELFIESGVRTDILYWLNAYEVSVIGNVHDNPELIGGAE